MRIKNVFFYYPIVNIPCFKIKIVSFNHKNNDISKKCILKLSCQKHVFLYQYVMWNKLWKHIYDEIFTVLENIDSN